MAKIKILFKELWALLKINSVEAMFCVYNAKNMLSLLQQSYRKWMWKIFRLEILIKT